MSPAAADGRPAGFAEIEGTLERVSFHDADSGYTVARLQPDDAAAPITVVGRMALPTCGASLRLEGRWVEHPRYGRQFEVSRYSERLPATIDGIRRYLGSGLIRGIGPVMAERIVERFGAETLEVIESSPERLAEVPGVGRKRGRQIVSAWREQMHVKDLMLFLQSHGVGTSVAVRVYRRYGDDAAAIVRHDPYRLAREVHGIGFTTADRIARRLGMPLDSPRRAEAGVLDALRALADEGHVFAARSALAALAERRLAVAAAEPTGAASDHDAAGPESGAAAEGVDRSSERSALDGPPGGAGPSAERIDEAVTRLVGAGELRADRLDPSDESDQAIYLPEHYYAEVGVANKIRSLISSDTTRLGAFRSIDWAEALAWLDRSLPHPLAPCQRDAVRSALTHKVTVMTGGPGTGKTTTVRAVLMLLQSRGRSARLAAPTGRAAKRLAEATGVEARTIHRLLELKPSEGWRFQRDEDRPLDADMVVIDEMSMVDLPLMSALMRAVDVGTHVLFVGDADQLPSVGPGNVLHDLVASSVVPTVALDRIFRQSATSFIVLNAHRINHGEMPLFDRHSRDFFLFKAKDAATAADWVVDIVSHRIPERFGLHPVDDVQVLSPMHRGQAGVAALNTRLQAVLNPPDPGRAEVAVGARLFRVGDKVMQVRNDYRKGVFNGDLGRLVAIDIAERRLEASFEGARVAYEHHETDELVHAFACSTHKSQGAEYPAVVLAILPEHYMLLQRNLLYTAVTRARRLCVLVGSPRAIARAVDNDEVAARNSGLAARLRSATMKEPHE